MLSIKIRNNSQFFKIPPKKITIGRLQKQEMTKVFSHSKQEILFQRRVFLFNSLVALDFALVAKESDAGPLDFVGTFWKSRQQANISKLLAPIEVSIQRLKKTEELLKMGQGMKAQQLLRQASLNCFTFEASSEDTIETKASLLTQNLKLADPCTLRIILKNVVSQLSPDDVAVKSLQSQLEEIVSSYSVLDDMLDYNVDFEKSQKLVSQLIGLTEDFKEGVRLIVFQE
eukprot:TRINITY_DN14174_c0_g1_i5.p2 TRINITY_DN14174_c0_g1~~TRINITY_DN14174_c0_g1_i5.p2  ORF type:complete len:241 (+),score=30.34 TRINITY_DN14174_c0_g1_i5:37-723(+)